MLTELCLMIGGVIIVLFTVVNYLMARTVFATNLMTMIKIN